MERFGDIKEVFDLIHLYYHQIVVCSLVFSVFWGFILLYTEEFISPDSRFKKGALYTILSVIGVAVVFFAMWVESKYFMTVDQDFFKRVFGLVLSLTR